MPAEKYYDSKKAHEYYMRTRKLKGRKRSKLVKTPTLASKKGLTNAKLKKAAKKRDSIIRKNQKRIQAIRDRVASAANNLSQRRTLPAGVSDAVLNVLRQRGNEAVKADRLTRLQLRLKREKAQAAIEKARKRYAKLAKTSRNKRSKSRPSPSTKKKETRQNGR